MEFCMQIKMKNNDMNYFLDNVFLKQGFEKTVLENGERVYTTTSDNGFVDMFAAFRPLNNIEFIKNCDKWEMLNFEDGICINQENCLEELANAY